ncbi:MAG: amidohydrolase [Halieaceae bacterium]|jgi:predicted amidohydrolase YtcJ|nr:amidohydrolase [Halieaceae bacterium]
MSLNRRRFIHASAAALAALSLPGCQRQKAAPTGPTTSADITVFHGGTVLPVDPAFSQHAALAINGNRILAVGSVDEVMAAAGNGARTIDLQGRTVLPGFIEPHMHFSLLAGFGGYPDIGAFNYPTFEGALAALREAAAGTPRDQWIMARQFDPVLLDPPRDLTIKELDPIAPEQPIFVLNASGHIGYVNSTTLKLAGITKDTPDPPGAAIGRYEDGTPNGVLYGTAAHGVVMQKNAALMQRMSSGFIEAGREVGDLAATLGITTLCDMATGGAAGPAELARYRQMYEGGQMKARIRAYLFDSAADLWDRSETQPFEGDALMRVAGWKIVSDGSNQGYTGRQREPYIGTDNRGIYYVQPDELKAKVATRTSQGWPMAIHGNGDAAIDSILDAMESAKADGIDVNALRCRIEHCSILHDEQIARMADLNMVPSFLINHVHYWGHVMRDRVFGPDKVKLLDRCAAVEDAGLKWVMHTDAPVSPLGSLQKIRTAVARDLWKEPDTVLAPDERVSVEAAIRAVTANAAAACHSEHEIGQLKPGLQADLVILEDDPREVEPGKIADISVSQTWMAGRQVFG